MQTVRERLLYLRKTVLGLSRKSFGDPIDMTESEIKNVEYSKTALKENKIRTICKEYGIREEWLRDGELPIKQPKSRGEEIGEIAARAAHRRPEDARAYFQRLYEDLGETKFLLMYEIFRQVLPQYDKPNDNG